MCQSHTAYLLQLSVYARLFLFVAGEILYYTLKNWKN